MSGKIVEWLQFLSFFGLGTYLLWKGDSVGLGLWAFSIVVGFLKFMFGSGYDEG